MAGEGGSVDDRTTPEIIESLRSLIEAIDDGRIEATDAQRAYLQGAVDSLVHLRTLAVRRVVWCSAPIYEAERFAKRRGWARGNAMRSLLRTGSEAESNA